MPSPRDITGELTRLPKRRLKTDRSPAPPTAQDPRPKGPALRGMAFDPVIWLTGMLFPRRGRSAVRFSYLDVVKREARLAQTRTAMSDDQSSIFI